MPRKAVRTIAPATSKRRFPISPRNSGVPGIMMFGCIRYSLEVRSGADVLVPCFLITHIYFSSRAHLSR